MSHLPTEIHLTMPDWWPAEMAHVPTHLTTVEERMAVVLRFARLNFERGSGGPFAAGVFERDTGKMLVIGVNRVMPNHCSAAHAEVMTLSLAQKLIGHYDLGSSGQPAHQLVVNWLPCAMCFGATLWSGIRSLVIAGSGPELEQLTGFDEGPIHPAWPAELQKRGVELINNVLYDEACVLFRDFGRSGTFVYNARLGA